MRRTLTCIIVGTAVTVVGGTAGADIMEGFDDIALLEGQGWAFQNNSEPPGVNDWFQGNDAVFPAHAGPPTSYIAANFNSSGSPGVISNWMMTPEVSLQNGDTFSFWTRTVDASAFPDRLEVRLSLAGASTDVGVGALDVGDFTELVLEINPMLDVGGYPEEWTQFEITISQHMGGAASGRIGFRYFVTDSGPTGANSNYFGIDTFVYTAIPAPGALALLGLAGLGARRRRRA